MRTAIISSLTDVRVTSFDTLAMVCSALKEISSSEDEIDEVSQVVRDFYSSLHLWINLEFGSFEKLLLVSDSETFSHCSE